MTVDLQGFPCYSIENHKEAGSMKKLLFLLLLCLILCGCGRTIDDVIAEDPHLVGVVTEVTETDILVQINDDDRYRLSCEFVRVSLEVEFPDSMTSFQVGDTVAVYFDGFIAETSPGQIPKPYAILLREPADRSINETD